MRAVLFEGARRLLSHLVAEKTGGKHAHLGIEQNKPTTTHQTNLNTWQKMQLYCQIMLIYFTRVPIIMLPRDAGESGI